MISEGEGDRGGLEGCSDRGEALGSALMLVCAGSPAANVEV